MRFAWIVCAVLVAGVVAVYSNTWHSPFLFDDAAFLQNPRTKQLWPLTYTLGDTARPLLRLSLAVNYAISGQQVWSYHAFNIGVHALAGLVLFGLVRRTLRLPGMPPRWQQRSVIVAACAAVCWAWHPLNTQSVTYIVQRAESLMGLFFLLTLYAFLRGATGHRIWMLCAVVACAAGMATKEVMVTAPLVVLLFDRTFLAGSWHGVRLRWRAHAALASTWAVLAAAWLLNLGPRPEPTAGFAYEGISSWNYALTQPGVLWHYVRTSLWPNKMCLDYSWPVSTSLADVWPAAVALGGVLVVAAWAARRTPMIGFLMTAVFIVLAPTSSIMPISVPAADHRMYLPLACLVVLLSLAVFAIADRGARQGGAALATAMLCLAAVGLGWGTLQRNRHYASAVSIWQAAVDDYPNSFTARINLGAALVNAGRVEDALAQFTAGRDLRPDESKPYQELAKAQRLLGRHDQAQQLFLKALELAPANVEAKVALGLGRVYVDAGRPGEALALFRRALEEDPGHLAAYDAQANLLLNHGQIDDAERLCRQALAADPHHLGTRLTLGRILQQQGHLEDGIAMLQAALAEQPDATGFNNLAIGLATARRLPEAAAAFRRGLELYRRNSTSDSADAIGHANCARNLATALVEQQRADESEAFYQEAIKLYQAHLRSVRANNRTAEATNGLGQAIAGLAAVYDSSNKPAQAAELRALLRSSDTAQSDPE